jgi:elongation factor G
MSKHSSKDVRNLAFLGGHGTGKTTLCEAVLHTTGAIGRMGSVTDGTTVSDVHDDEKAKQHSIRLGVMHADHKGARFNLLDTPGFTDFAGEVWSGLAAAEMAVLVVDGPHGLSFQDSKQWGRAERAGRAHAVVVTKADQDEFDYGELLTQLSETLNARCLALTVPDGTGKAFQGAQRVPFSGGEGAVATAAEALVEAVVEIDEEAMLKFLEEDTPPSADEARDLLRRSIVAGEVVPVFVVSGLDGKGVTEMLDCMADVFPSPHDGPALLDQEDNPVPADSEGASAMVFKTLIDPYVGKLCLLRVISGQLSHGDTVTLARTEKSVRIGNLQSVQGKDHENVETAIAGDIVAVAKLEDVETSDTLHDPAHPRHMDGVHAPKAMAARSIEPENHADDVKLATALKRVHAEDPSFTFERHESTGELVVHGTSIMHIETHLKRITEDSKIPIKISIPRVALKETITGGADGHHRHKKQTGGRGQFAEVFLKIMPAERGTGFVFADKTVGGSGPTNFVPALEKGIAEALNSGVIAGYPVVDVEVHITDGKYHDVDSDEASFRKAGARAFKDAFQKARAVLLEPMLDIEVAVPSDFMGAITSDMTGRRGQISGMDAIGAMQIVKARVPQKEVLTYPTVLNSLTHGEGTYTAEFHDYEVMPSNVQQEIMAEYQPVEDED